MDRQIVIDMVVGDTAPDMTFRFTGLTLSVYNAISMKLTKPDGTTKISKTVTPAVTATDGTVTFAATDLLVGRSEAEFLFDVDGAGAEFTLPRKYPIIFNVRANNQ